MVLHQAQCAAAVNRIRVLFQLPYVLLITLLFYIAVMATTVLNLKCKHCRTFQQRTMLQEYRRHCPFSPTSVGVQNLQVYHTQT